MLFAFCYTIELGGSYLIMVENFGNGNYNSNEYFFEKAYDFAHCVDYDSDGNYEIIALEGIETTKRDGALCSFELDGLSIAETPNYFNIESYIGYNCIGDRNFYVADIDNDGKYDGLFNVNDSGYKMASEQLFNVTTVAFINFLNKKKPKCFVKWEIVSTFAPHFV